MYRVLIADDEVIECRGIEVMLQSYFECIEILPSVHNGIDFIKSVTEARPDAAILDINMPGFNGLEALEIIRMKEIPIQIVINTAYSDFELIQKAMVLGASDYLLKPIEQEALCETMSRVFDKIQRKRQETQMAEHSFQKIERMTKVMEEEMMSSILLGKPNENSFQLYWETKKREYPGGVMAAGKVLEQNQEIYLDKIEPMAKKELGRFCHCHTKVYQNILYLYLIPVGDTEEERYREWAAGLLQYLTEKVWEKEQIELEFGVSKWYKDFRKMTEAFRQSSIAVLERHNGRIHFFEEGSEKLHQRSLFSGIWRNQLLLTAEQGKWKDVKQELKKQIENADREIEEIAVDLTDLLLQIYQYLYDRSKIRITYQLSYSAVRMELERAQDKEEIYERCIVVWNEMMKKEEKKTQKDFYIERAILYMEQNYSSDLSLEEVAEAVGVSTFYLSRIISQKNHSTFIELLTDIRMREAIRMIRQKDTIIRDIGQKVGYFNATYFYKVFKKHTGMTVGEMREHFQE